MRYLTYTQLGEAGVLSVTEAADVLRIGRTKMYQLVNSGEIKILPFNRPKRISALWLKAYIDSDAVLLMKVLEGLSHAPVGSL